MLDKAGCNVSLYNVFVWSVLSVLAFLMFRYLVDDLAALFFQHDAYYYLAVADSLFDSGEMLDVSSSPPKAVISPQNGIVFVMVLLKFLGITNHIDILFSVAVINYICFVCFAYLIYKIYIAFGIDRHISLVIAASIILSLYYSRIFIQSINDPIFIALSTFILYVILQKKQDYKTLLLLTACALVLASFRISGIFVFLSAALAYFYIKNPRMGLFFLFLAVVTYLVQALVVHYFILDQSGIDAMKEKTFDYYSLSFFLNNILHTVQVNIPEGLFAYEKMYTGLVIDSSLIMLLITGSIVISFFLFIKRAISSKDFKYIYLSIYIALYLCFLQIFFAVITRYILVVTPFFALLLLLSVLKNHKVYLAYGLLTVSVLISVLVPPEDLQSKEGVSKRQFYHQTKEMLKNNVYSMLVADSRVAYLLLNKSSTGVLRNVRYGNVLVVGPRKWSMSMISHLRSVREPNLHIQEMGSYTMYNGTKVHSFFITP